MVIPGNEAGAKVYVNGREFMSAATGSGGVEGPYRNSILGRSSGDIHTF